MMQFIVNIWGFDMDVRADITAEEPMTWDHPGAPALADIFHVYVGGVDIMEMVSADQYRRIEDHVLRQL